MFRGSGRYLQVMICALAACFLAMTPSIPPELDAYVKRPDPSFAWSIKSPGQGSLHIRMTSQTWQNVRWTHDIVVVDEREPGEQARATDKAPAPKNTNAAVLYITGGVPNPADLNEAGRLSKLARMPVALLFGIPNQPLYGKKEDDLIAHTFEQYMVTGDPNWLLLFPMTKSAIRAMDALQAATAKSPNPLKKFVVIGASKRGWTTWLTAATGDKRVIGIAPMVFDNLKFKAQLKHQLDSWGKYSEMIGDYTEKGLDQIVDTPRGSHMVAMVDPYSYLSRIRVPKIIVNGANDRYWTVDALSLYWNKVSEPKYCTIVPNAGHGLGDGKQALEAIGAFARSCVGELKIEPKLSVRRWSKDGRSMLTISHPDAGNAARIMGFWGAQSPTLDFRDARWERSLAAVNLDKGLQNATVVFEQKGAGRAAVFAEVRYHIAGSEFSLTSPVFVLR